MTENQIRQEDNKLVLYTDKRGNVELRADIEKDTIWASQAQIARLFDVNPQAIIKHLKNIYREGELVKTSTCSKMEQVQIESGRAVKRSIDFYNLDAIIAVGYRVNSKKATQFRMWATRILREYLVKGYNLNERQLARSEQSFSDIEEALAYMKSTIGGKPLKAKMSIRITKDLVG